MKNKSILRNIIRESIQELQNEHDETDMSNPEEKREVKIGKEIINRVDTLIQDPNPNRITQMSFEIKKLAKELIDMHKNMEEVAPPGWQGSVKRMKKHKNITNPWALAWSMKNKGYTPHHKEKVKEVNYDMNDLGNPIIAQGAPGSIVRNQSKITGHSISKPVKIGNEWVVKWMTNGKRDENKTYYTDDEKDAFDTYKLMLKQAEKENGK